MMAVKPLAAGGVGGDGVAGAGDGDEAAEAADGAGDQHGAQVDLGHVDAGVAGGVVALPGHGDLIALLGVLEVGVHAHHQDDGQQHVQAVGLAEQLREPAGPGVLVDDAHGVGAHRVLPTGPPRSWSSWMAT